MRAGPVTRLHAGSTWFKAFLRAMAVGAKVGTWLGAWRASLVCKESHRSDHMLGYDRICTYSQCEDVPFCKCSRFQYMDVHNLTKHRKARSTLLALLWNSRNLGQCAHKTALCPPLQYIEECKVKSIFLHRDDHIIIVELFSNFFTGNFC